MLIKIINPEKELTSLTTHILAENPNKVDLCQSKLMKSEAAFLCQLRLFLPFSKLST